MDIEKIGFTLDLIGKLMISYTAISVHMRVSKEHKIDDAVLETIRSERWIGIAGIAFMITGWMIHVL